jgi:hypothetical protein
MHMNFIIKNISFHFTDLGYYMDYSNELDFDFTTKYDIVQLETRNFGHRCQYTVKKCKVGFTLLTSILPFAKILIDIKI